MDAEDSYTKTMKIVLAEKVSPATLAVSRKSRIGTSSPPMQSPKLGPGGLEAELADADALVVRSAVQVDAKLSSPRPNCAPSVAPAWRRQHRHRRRTHSGIVVMKHPRRQRRRGRRACDGLMISMARSIPRANSTTHAAKWEKKSLQAPSCAQDPGHRRPRTHRSGGRPPRAQLRHGADRLRPLHRAVVAARTRSRSSRSTKSSSGPTTSPCTSASPPRPRA